MELLARCRILTRLATLSALVEGLDHNSGQ
jgi:hypothetical protein